MSTLLEVKMLKYASSQYKALYMHTHTHTVNFVITSLVHTLSSSLRNNRETSKHNNVDICGSGYRIDGWVELFKETLPTCVVS